MSLDHLVDLGHRNIAVVHGPTQNNDRTRERIKGTSSHRTDVNLTFHETELSVAGGSAAVSQLPDLGGRLDALLCLTDILAFGVLFEVQRMGLTVPDDVSVMGIHDLPASEFVTPRLSTVRLPAQQMGRRAAEAMAKWVEEGTRPDPVCFESELLPRETTKIRSQ